MFNHVLHLSLQQFLYACGSARDKSVCVRRLSTETVEVTDVFTTDCPCTYMDLYFGVNMPVACYAFCVIMA